MNENDFQGCAKFTEYMRQQTKHRGQEQTDASTGSSLEVFSSLANDDVKVNQTQRYLFLITFRTRLILWILMETTEFAAELRSPDRRKS